MNELTIHNPIWGSGLVFSLIAASVVLFGYWWNTRATRVDRQRQLFAEAFGAIMDYREYAYIVRRRTSDSEVNRITASLSEIQAQLNTMTALLLIESKTVGQHYEQLVKKTKEVAGDAIRNGWDQPIRQVESVVPIEDVDLSSLHSYDKSFIVTVRHHLDVLPSWAHRKIKLAD